MSINTLFNCILLNPSVTSEAEKLPLRPPQPEGTISLTKEAEELAIYSRSEVRLT